MVTPMLIPHIKDYCDTLLPANAKLADRWFGMRKGTLLHVIRTKDGICMAVPIKDHKSVYKPIEQEAFERVDPSDLTNEYDVCAEVLVLRETLSPEARSGDGILSRIVPCPGKPYLYRVEIALDPSIHAVDNSHDLSDEIVEKLALYAGYTMHTFTLTNYIPKYIALLPTSFTLFGNSIKIGNFQEYRKSLSIEKETA